MNLNGVAGIDTPWELAATILVIVGTLAAGWTANYQVHRKQGNDLKAVKDQVKNGHGTNLRDDIDELRDLLRDGLGDLRRDVAGIRQDIGGIRGELRAERQERIEGDQRC